MFVLDIRYVIFDVDDDDNEHESEGVGLAVTTDCCGRQRWAFQLLHP